MIICDTLRKYGAPSLSFGSENFQTGVNEVALLCMRSEIHQELYFTVCPALDGYLPKLLLVHQREHQLAKGVRGSIWWSPIVGTIALGELARLNLRGNHISSASTKRVSVKFQVSVGRGAPNVGDFHLIKISVFYQHIIIAVLPPYSYILLFHETPRVGCNLRRCLYWNCPERGKRSGEDLSNNQQFSPENSPTNLLVKLTPGSNFFS